jgi:hypothetical protein
MRYRLRDQLSACVIGAHAVFLDIDADRYFRLPEALERAFLAYSAKPLEAPASQLLEHGILVPAGPENDHAPEHMDLPLRSALEMPDHGSGCAFVAVPEVLTTLQGCRSALRTRAFAQVLALAGDYRDGHCPASLPGAASERALLHAARLFLRARRYIPIAPCCLPDSLALTRFLARRRLHSHIVIGVAGEPFSAHCWVQAGDLALNETVGRAWAHTIIRVL